MAADEIPVRCSCGALQGVARALEPARVNRVMCYCKFCATYADVLGRSDDVLDERRGSEVVQISPRSLVFTRGHEHIACLRLTKSGAMRFYASCCNTPIANTMARPDMPFMGISPLMIPWKELGLSREQLFGPIRARVNGRFEASESRALRARRIDLVTMLLRFAPKFFGWYLRGDQAHSPLYDAKTRAPVAKPVRVDRDARLQPTR